MGNHVRGDLPPRDIVQQKKMEIDSSLKDFPDEIRVTKKQLRAARMRVALADWNRERGKTRVNVSPELVARALCSRPTGVEEQSVRNQLVGFDKNAGDLMKLRKWLRGSQIFRERIRPQLHMIVAQGRKAKRNMAAAGLWPYKSRHGKLLPLLGYRLAPAPSEIVSRYKIQPWRTGKSFHVLDADPVTGPRLLETFVRISRGEHLPSVLASSGLSKSQVNFPKTLRNPHYRPHSKTSDHATIRVGNEFFEASWKPLVPWDVWQRVQWWLTSPRQGRIRQSTGGGGYHVSKYARELDPPAIGLVPGPDAGKSPPDDAMLEWLPTSEIVWDRETNVLVDPLWLPKLRKILELRAKTPPLAVEKIPKEIGHSRSVRYNKLIRSVCKDSRYSIVDPGMWKKANEQHQTLMKKPTEYRHYVGMGNEEKIRRLVTDKYHALGRPVTFREIMTECPVSRAALSFHLTSLRDKNQVVSNPIRGR